MPNTKGEPTHKFKPEGNLNPAMPHSPDVKAEGWSAEHIAEESAYQDGTEVKEEMIEGKWIKRENKAGRIFSPPSSDFGEWSLSLK